MSRQLEHDQNQSGHTPGPSTSPTPPGSAPETPVPKNPFTPGPVISEPDTAIKFAVPLPPKDTE